jgi:hypothetical protein
MSLNEAKDPNTRPTRLAELSQSKDPCVVEAVAKNPGTPPERLLLLAQKYPAQFLENPVLPLLLLENPNALHALKKGAARELLRVSAGPPAWLFGALAAHADEYVRSCIAESPNTPIATLELLAIDSHENVRSRVAANLKTPMATLELLASDPHSYVSQRVIKNLRQRTKVREPRA